MPVYRVEIINKSGVVLVSASSPAAAVKHIAQASIICERVDAAQVAKEVQAGVPFQEVTDQE